MFVELFIFMLKIQMKNVLSKNKRRILNYVIPYNFWLNYYMLYNKSILVWSQA